MKPVEYVMQVGSISRSVVIAMLVSLTGCAAPIKALMGEPNTPQIDKAALQAADSEEAQLRAALLEKGRALVKARNQASTTPASRTPPNLTKGPASQGASQAVTAMLARAKSAAAPQPAPAAAPDLKNAFHVKDETRLRDSQAGSLHNRPDSALIRFAPGVTALDAEGNKALADLARRSDMAPSATIVLVAGLHGAGSPWERMQAASERLEIVARHVPAPLRVERKFEIELESQTMRLELHRGQR